MLENAFIGWTKAPTDEELSQALGAARAWWDDLVRELALPEYEWHSYSAKYGWSMRAKKGKRNIAYCVPCKGVVEVAFLLGGKAISAAKEAKLSAAAVKMIDSAPKYPEGTMVRFAVKKKSDLALVKKLEAAKLAN